MIFFKVLMPGRIARGNGGAKKITYPPPGKWTRKIAKKKCALCSNGYHLASDPARAPD